MVQREYGKGRKTKFVKSDGGEIEFTEKELSEFKLMAENDLFARQRNYIDTFIKDSPVVMAVLKDLEEFCHGNQSCFHADARIHAMYEGRREVYLRIRRHIDLSSQELWDTYQQKKF